MKQLKPAFLILSTVCIGWLPAESVTELKQIPSKEIEFMRNAEQADLYAIPAHPQQADPHGIAGFPILAHVRIRSDEARRILVSAFELAVQAGEHSYACFDPHHAFQFRRADERHTFVICFHCGEARELIQRTGQPDEQYSYRVCPWHGDAFNAVLDAGDPEFRSKALFIGSYATKSILQGEEISALNTDTREEWRDQLTGHELGKIDFAKHPKAARQITEGSLYTEDDIESEKSQNP